MLFWVLETSCAELFSSAEVVTPTSLVFLCLLAAWALCPRAVSLPEVERGLRGGGNYWASLV